MTHIFRIINQDALIMALAVSLCLILIEHLHLSQGCWAVITIAAIYHHGPSQLTTKAILRIFGTILGGLLGTIIYLICGNNLILISLCCFVVLFLTNYLNFQTSPYNYLFVVSNFTVLIIVNSLLISKMPHAALDRCLEVALGILIVFLVKVLVIKLIQPKTKILEENLYQKVIQSYQKVHYDQRKLIQAFIIAFAVALSIMAWSLNPKNLVIWSSIPMLLVLEADIKTIRNKSYTFMIATGIAAIYGALFAMNYHHQFWVILIALVGGFGFSGYIMSKRQDFPLLGNILACTLSFTLMAGYPNDSYTMALERLCFVLFGILAALLIIFIFQKRFD